MNDDNFNKNQELYEIDGADSSGAIEYIIEDDAKPMTLIQRIVSVFLSPGKLMENLSKYPKMLAPLVVFLVVGVALAAIYPQVTRIALEEQSLMMTERYGTDIMRSGTEAMDEMGGIVSAATATSAVLSAITGPYISGFFAAVGLLILSFIFRVKSKFTHYYSMYVHIAMVTSVLTLVSTVFMLITNSSIDVLSLGMLMPGGNTLSATYMALSAVSVANIWQAVLVCIGLKAFTGCNTNKAAMISGTYFAISVAISAGSAFVWAIYYDFFNNMMFQL